MIKRLDLGNEAIIPLILKMSWPSIVAMIAMSIYNFIDTFWLSRLSSQALAALTVCFPLQMIFAAIGVGTGVDAGSFSARRNAGHVFTFFPRYGFTYSFIDCFIFPDWSSGRLAGAAHI
jgi:Na+-driven multidrug efflux pump